MKSKVFRYSTRFAVVLTMLGSSISVWAQCTTPYPATWNYSDPDNWVLEPLPDGSSLFTDIDGKWEGCPEGTTYEGYIGTENGTWSYVYNDTTVVVQSEPGLSAGTVKWTARCYGDVDEFPGLDEIACTDVPLLDSAVTLGARSANACLYSFGLDAASATVGFEGTNFTGVYLCADNVYEPIPVPPPPPAAVSENCVIGPEDPEPTQTIYGVQVTCPVLNEGEQRTVFVANDRECDAEGNCSVPEGFGFANADGVVDFGNICICVGDPPTDELGNECASTDAYQEAYPTIPPCDLGDEAQPTSTNVELQNPRCITVGGTRRCY